ncbi:hypothetical protein F5Y15DRAFT_422963 [Xylariaceae sp. FL0016]|nr:hypothetical protein F5Y15DRAFT_422963 [Xylariaceae sp. FL0016]
MNNQRDMTSLQSDVEAEIDSGCYDFTKLPGYSAPWPTTDRFQVVETVKSPPYEFVDALRIMWHSFSLQYPGLLHPTKEEQAKIVTEWGIEQINRWPDRSLPRILYRSATASECPNASKRFDTAKEGWTRLAKILRQWGQTQGRSLVLCVYATYGKPRYACALGTQDGDQIWIGDHGRWRFSAAKLVERFPDATARVTIAVPGPQRSGKETREDAASRNRFTHGSQSGSDMRPATQSDPSGSRRWDCSWRRNAAPLTSPEVNGNSARFCVPEVLQDSSQSPDSGHMTSSSNTKVDLTRSSTSSCSEITVWRENIIQPATTMSLKGSALVRSLEIQVQCLEDFPDALQKVDQSGSNLTLTDLLHTEAPWEINLHVDNLRSLLQETWFRLVQHQVLTEHREKLQTSFKELLMNRCAHISAFVKHAFSKHHKRPIQENPDLGPSPEAAPDPQLDALIFEKGVMKQNTSEFEPRMHPLILMYGFGQYEIDWLHRNKNKAERSAQSSTVCRYHELQAKYGPGNFKDVAETLEFCFYATRNSRKSQTSEDYKKLCDIRRMEFDIAKRMVNELHDDYEKGNKRRSPPILRRKWGREGDWEKLAMADRNRLLGTDDLKKKYAHLLKLPQKSRSSSCLSAHAV